VIQEHVFLYKNTCSCITLHYYLKAA
jgi:hypothetical protein